ncbi:MAG: M48 family metalloprotease [Hyphomicrobiales bacterium]
MSLASTLDTSPERQRQAAYKYAVSAAVNGHGRSFETTADKVGLKYMVAAGYDGCEAPKVFQKFLQLYGKKSGVVNFFHGNHPTNMDRIKTLNSELAGKYRGKDFSRATRNTSTYAKLSARYRG